MNAWQIPLIIVELILGGGILCRIIKLEVSAKATIIVNKAFIFLSFVLSVVIILALFDVYIRGYWSAKILIWLFMLIASLLYAAGNSKVLTSLWRIVTGIIFYFPVANIVIFLLVPLLGPLPAFGIWLHILGDRKAICYEDTELRIQYPSSDQQFKSWPRLFIKKGIVELGKGEMRVNYYFDPDSLKVEKTKELITVYLLKKGFEPEPFRFKR